MREEPVYLVQQSMAAADGEWSRDTVLTVVRVHRGKLHNFNASPKKGGPV
jgi:hypothetical protein